jgi:hypothetical protein
VTDWLAILGTIEKKLGLKENMQLDDKLVKFLEAKRKSNNTQDQVAILEVFDDVLPNIKEIYKKKINERDVADEFQLDSIASGINSLDGLFFLNYFLPSAVFYMYKSWMSISCDEEIMFTELFTLGGGSKTYNLFPEVHSICEKCAGDKMESLGSKSRLEIQQINMHVFLAQKRNNFAMTKLSTLVQDNDSDDDKCKSICNPFESDDDVVDKASSDIVNPFNSSSSESDPEEAHLYSCENCFDSFPSADFVKLHNTVFHSGQVVKMKYVENPESLMTSFVQPVDDSSFTMETVASKDMTVDKSNKVGEIGNQYSSSDPSKSTENNTKYNFRKRLNWS